MLKMLWGIILAITGGILVYFLPITIVSVIDYTKLQLIYIPITIIVPIIQVLLAVKLTLIADKILLT